MTTIPSATPNADDLDPIYFLAATDPAAMQAMNTELVDGFRATRGQLDGGFAGVPLLLLTSTGARTGHRVTTPMNYTRTGPSYVVVASKSGAPRHPDWYHNLLAHPDATIEVADTTIAIRARVTDGSERKQLFDQHTAALPNFAVYQARTTRRLPVLVLEPTGRCPGTP